MPPKKRRAAPVICVICFTRPVYIRTLSYTFVYIGILWYIFVYIGTYSCVVFMRKSR